MGSKLDKSQIKKTYKMKFSSAVLFAVASAQDKKVPPRHPLQRLNRLTEFTAEIMNDWFSFLPSQEKWVAKFAKNADRMARNFERETNDVDSMMKNNSHTVDHLMTEKDVMLMLTDTTVKTQLSVSNSLPLVTANGLSDISATALVKRTSVIKSTE